MIKQFKIIVITIIICFFVNYDSFSQFNLWSVGTAKTIARGKYSKGIFQPFRYGLTESVELSVFPAAFFVLPNLSLKKHWYTTENDWLFSTRHAINYPSIFLKLISRKGFGGVLPDKTKVPHIFAFTNEALASTWLIKETSCSDPNLLLTLKAGLKFALKLGDNTVPTIDYPLVYQQSIIYQKNVLWYVGADLDGHVSGSVDFCVDLDFLSVGMVKDYAIEHKAMLIFHATPKISIVGGYKISYGTYPFGNKFYAMPLVDIMITLERKKKLNKKLFGEPMY